MSDEEGFGTRTMDLAEGVGEDAGYTGRRHWEVDRSSLRLNLQTSRRSWNA